MEPLMENLPATLAGGVAALCLTASPTMNSRSGMLSVQLAAAIAFATHYAFLGVFAASAVNLLGCVQIGAALFAGQSRTLNSIGWILIPLMLLAGVHFWTGPVSAFSVAAMTLIAIGRMQQRQEALRILVIAGGVFWVAHDFAIGAWIAFAADIGCLITGALGFAALYVRVRLEWRPRLADLALAPAAPGRRTVLLGA